MKAGGADVVCFISVQGPVFRKSIVAVSTQSAVSANQKPFKQNAKNIATDLNILEGKLWLAGSGAVSSTYTLVPATVH